MTLSKAEYQDQIEISSDTSQSPDLEYIADILTTLQNDDQEGQDSESGSSSIKSQGGNKRLEVVPSSVENGIPQRDPTVMDPTVNGGGPVLPEFQPDETLSFPPEDEIESIPEEPEPEGGDAVNVMGIPGGSHVGQTNFVNPPATLQFFSPSLGQTILIPGTLNLTWSPIGLIVTPQVFNIEARNLLDNSIISVAKNIPSSTRMYPWNIPQGTKEGMYRLFVYTETGRVAPVFPGHLSTYEGEVFELLYTIPPSQERSLDILPASGTSISHSSTLILSFLLSSSIWIYW
ncbi:hypothetical protein K7432_004204 [Basidiobolus ranarum]|uniref:Uncharacterized protein n=1 Tax=Basidiobolus ranarum TaxID=34480 RepID=A0ABR2WYI9_9FUNG